jgi:hypothetical protein
VVNKCNIQPKPRRESPLTGDNILKMYPLADLYNDDNDDYADPPSHHQQQQLEQMGLRF